MDRDNLERLLAKVKAGEISLDLACRQLAKLPFHDIDFAKVDSHRLIRQGTAEVIYCPGKTAGQVVAIARKLKETAPLVVATRAEAELAEVVLPELSGSCYYRTARLIAWGQAEQKRKAKVALVTAGTGDLPVAEEAAVFLEISGIALERIFDVGVAGIHRLFASLDALFDADAVIVVAGMDGALPSVVAGLVDKPVIAVPTSIGYGASFEGMAALLSMLTSCAAGLTVVNIDNGFGAAYAALRILACQKESKEAFADAGKNLLPLFD